MNTPKIKSLTSNGLVWWQLIVTAWPIVILCVQNLVIFQRHYFKDYGFPWDFSQGYYGLTAFWTTLVSQGVIPSWVPFYSMGMPFDLVLQTGFHYPPLWIFSLLKIEYSLHAAVVFQCLHVLFGAIGMFFFLRLSFQDSRDANIYALVGAFLFQFFGGFYSNAEHPDIIRAFSFAPWLFFLFTIPNNSPKITWRIFFIPLIILLVATGAYPGNLISSIVVIGLYLLLQLTALWQKGLNVSTVFLLALIFFSAGIIGGGLSVFHLGPAWFFKDFLFRAQEVGRLSTYGLGIEHLPALFLNNAVVPGEISMTSTFVTIPALVAISYIPFEIVKKQWPMAIVLCFSALMAAGDKSFFWFILNKLSSVFQLSRFTSSDYRIFIGIALIYFAVSTLKALIAGQVSSRDFFFRTILVFLWFFQGIYVSYPILRSLPVYTATVICLFSVFCLAISILYKANSNYKLIFIILPFLILVSFDAYRVLPQMTTWQLESSKALYRIYKWPLEQNGHLLTNEIISKTPTRRPPRIAKDNYMDYSWEGYITGRYTLSTFIYSNMLQSTSLILANPTYKEFMLMEWRPLLFEKSQVRSGELGLEVSTNLVSSAMHSSTNTNQNMVRQMQYGVNSIKYDISLDKPSIMVENEMYFPGWQAVLISQKGTSSLQAFSINGVFRAWLLPAGNYEMIASFKFPHIMIFDGISGFVAIVWILLVPVFSKIVRSQSYIAE